MSLYNMLFGNNPLATAYLGMLNLSPTDVGRFRDCFLRKTDLGEIQIVVYTRNGGGNREEYEDVTDTLRAHPDYISDYDDDFDCTYASYVFRVPEQFKDVVAKMVDLPNQQVDPAARFQDLLQKLQSGNKDDPSVQHAMKVGKEILGPIIDSINKKE